MKRAGIICVGDELTTGLILNGNGTFLARTLTDAGLSVLWIKTVGDEVDLIAGALDEAFSRVDLCVVSGGLGPTSDDKTIEAASCYFHSPLEMRSEVIRRLEARFRTLNRPMPACNRKQGLLPKNAVLLDNSLGTAPGLLIEKENRRFFFVPGVPAEMKAIVREEIIPRVASSAGFQSRMLLTFGVPESELYEKILDFEKQVPGIRLAFLPGPSGVRLRMYSARGSDIENETGLDAAEQWIRKMLGPAVYGSGEETLAGVAARLLTERRLTLSVAESCTGGLISHYLTDIPGSSSWFNRCVVAYSNEAKMELLNVSLNTLNSRGAVSAETAEAMALGVRESGGTDIGLSTTGIAGPGGGTPEKPVGLVWLGLSHVGGTLSTSRMVGGPTRRINKERFAMAALDVLRRFLLENSL
ncbi:MAG TPA: competence/damage-inducible protein A [bacterium]|nr:competence/damage-inducible protein A [bacterium]